MEHQSTPPENTAKEVHDEIYEKDAFNDDTDGIQAFLEKAKRKALEIPKRRTSNRKK